MDTRTAFRTFMKFQLEQGESLSQLGLSKEDIEKIVSGMENDPNFYEDFEAFLVDFLEHFAENYGVPM